MTPVAHTYVAMAGTIALLAGLLLLDKTRRFIARSSIASGKLVSYSEWTTARNRTNYFPVVAFTANDGKSYELTGTAGYSAKNFPQGYEFSVRYTSSDPTKAFIDNFSNLWLGPLALTVLGIGALIVVVASPA